MSGEVKDLLFEIGTEELPSKSLYFLSESFGQLFTQALSENNLQFSAFKCYATPRRITVHIENLAIQQPTQKIERKGPSVKAAKDSEGNPSKAALGFARSCGVEFSDLDLLETDKGSWLVFRKNQEGQLTRSLLPQIAQLVVNQLPIAKRMNWGNGREGFTRPVHWILFLFGDTIIPCELFGKKSSNQTFGHRFHAPNALTILNPKQYEITLEKEGRVIADFSKRKEQIRQQVVNASQSSTAKAIIDEDLLSEVAGLVEWPVALVGKFDNEFLEVPQEALISAMQEHQKYFPIVNNNHRLLPLFVAISNIESKAAENVVSGNEKVIRPRLADAKFFFDTDKKHTLQSFADKLDHVTFQYKLGSVGDKVQRVTKLAGYIAQKIKADVASTEKSALLCKADLTTNMVGEFPDLQGIMGGYYAEHANESNAVITAIREHYLPKFSGDSLPSTLEGCALAIADRLDSLVGIFAIGQIPSGDKDPFALRRASLGIIRIIIGKTLDLDLKDLISFSEQLFESKLGSVEVQTPLLEFFGSRYRAHYKEQGISTPIIISVENKNTSKPLDFHLRILAVQEFSTLPEAKSLSAANKRVKNILNKQDKNFALESLNTELLSETQEIQLAKALEKKLLEVTPFFKQGAYTQALKSLADLHTIIDEFFDGVMVMADDPNVRTNRLILLSQLQGLFSEVADISMLTQ